MFRPSPFDLDVRFSPHPALDILRFPFYPCADNRGNFHVLLSDYFCASCYDSHLCDEGERVHRRVVSYRRRHIYGSAFLGQQRFHYHIVYCFVHSSKLGLHRMRIYPL
ncbi:hypothetical protein NUACC26_011210 [Scytonema sp. NUACC26]